MLQFGTPCRTYAVRVALAVGLYSVVGVGVDIAFARGAVPMAFAIPVALVPAIPLVLIALSALALLRDLDELQRRVVVDAMAFRLR